MEGDTVSGGMISRLVGLYYALTYLADDRRVLVFTLGGWVRFLSLVLIGLAILKRWSLVAILGLVALAILIRIGFWLARRAGYVAFYPEERNSPKVPSGLADEEKVAVQATGLFSVMDREDYVLLRPADYWRVPNGDHAIMVEQRPGRFLYQFIQPGSLQSIKPGSLYFGRRPRISLSLSFLASWGPEFAGGTATSIERNQNGRSAKLERKAYLSFVDEATRQAVWHSLLSDASHPASRKI